MEIQKKSQVVLQTAFLGDLFLSIPLFKQIKSRFPEDRLVLICKKGQGAYFLQKGLVDQIFEVQKGDRSSYKDIVSDLNKQNIDHLFCVHRSVRSQLMSQQIKARYKIGFKSWLGIFIFNKMVPYQVAWPDALRQLFILSPLKLEVTQRLSMESWFQLNQPLADGRLPQVPEFLSGVVTSKDMQASRRIALFPGSVWATKKWTLQGYVETAQAFIDLGFEVYLMGGPDEKGLCELIQTQVPKAQILAGQMKIPASIDFISTCRLIICNDSAPAHMAASQNVPVVAIFGPTTLDLGFRPWSSRSVVVEMIDMACRPCGKHGHHVCPLGHHNCMNFIDSKRVVQAGVRLMQETSL